MNTYKTITGERVTNHGDHIVTEPTHAELITLAGEDVYTELQSIENAVLMSMAECERCGDWVDDNWIADGICGHCHDELLLDDVPIARDYLSSTLDQY